MLTAADLLAGADAVRDVEVPADLLGGLPAPPADRRVRLKPLTVNDLRLVARAARDNDELTAALMVQRSLVEPALTVRDVSRMPVGPAAVPAARGERHQRHLRVGGTGRPRHRRPAGAGGVPAVAGLRLDAGANRQADDGRGARASAAPEIRLTARRAASMDEPRQHDAGASLTRQRSPVQACGPPCRRGSAAPDAARCARATRSR